MHQTDSRKPTAPRDVFLSRPVLGFVSLLALIGIMYLLPGTERLRLLSPKPEAASHAHPAASDQAAAPIGEAHLVDKTEDRPDLAIPDNPTIPDPQSAGLPALPPAVRTKAPPLPIEDATGHALDHFRHALVATERKQPGAITRVLHYGDSLLAVDYVSGTLRRKFQKRFGDAGHGYMPIANPWPGYFHNDVLRKASTEWTVSRVVGPFNKDGFYGLGGVSFVGRNKAAWSSFATATKGPVGRKVSRFGIQYLQQPGGGALELTVDMKHVESIETAGEETKFTQVVKKVPDGPHAFRLRVVRGPVRAFGTWMERDVPGVVWDSVGIQGARLRFLDKSNDAHWATALKSRHPDLVVLEFGLNESGDGFAYPMDRYKETSMEVVKQIRTALPRASCLIVAPNDVAKKRGTAIVSRAVMPSLVKVQREVAKESGCAFFDTFKAMGGVGSMAIWHQRGIGQADLTHPTAVGADVIGSWIYQALMNDYEAYRSRFEAPPASSAGAAPSSSAAAGAGAVPSASSKPAR